MENNLSDEKLMRMAKKRVKTKQYLRSQGYLFTIIGVVLTAIYFITNIYLDEKTFFWPVYPISGMLVAYLIQVIIFIPDMYGNKRNTEDAIQREYEKLKSNA